MSGQRDLFLNGVYNAFQEQDTNENDVLCLNYDSEESEYPRLNEIVREQYLKYLERKLKENYCTWKQRQAEQNAYLLPEIDGKLLNCDEDCQSQFIRHTAELLEDTALQACMIARFYQRAMIQIITNVRNCTQDQRLVKQLANLLNCQNHLELKSFNKKRSRFAPMNPGEHKSDEKNMFSEEFSQDSARMDIDEQDCNLEKEVQTDKIIKTEDAINQIDHAIIELNEENKNSGTDLDQDGSNDSVDLELARMFNDDYNELNEIFGIKDDRLMQDPLVSCILKEIEQSDVGKHGSIKEVDQTNYLHQRHPSPRKDEKAFLSVDNEVSKKKKNTLLTASSGRKDEEKHAESPAQQSAQEEHYPPRITDLSKSLWPCELHRQKKKLNNFLSCLIDEDYRWMDIFRWKFEHLFGDDSDDEFVDCSPTMEWDEVLIGSCVRRITPWIVKHLMPPLREGLIGNRFLFKKLAKQLSHAIVIVNQYPDEAFIKYAIENFFCIRSRVNSIDDLIDMPNIFSGYV